jgi:integrase
MKRYPTDYPGVFYRIGKRIGRKGTEKIFYIVFKKDGKVFEEKAGRQYADDMTPARAAGIRSDRIEGKRLSRKEIRENEQAEKAAEKNKWSIERLWSQYKATKNNLKGAATDESRFEKHIKPVLGNKQPGEILPLDIKRLEKNLLKKKAPGTAKNAIELLRRIINFGIKNKLCAPIDFKIQLPTVHNEKIENLSELELKRLLKAIKEDSHPQAGNIMLIALFTGMRRGELFKLKWQDVDFEKGFISIREPKGGPGQRIPLNDAARGVLEGCSRHKKSPFVFPGRGGRQRTDINKAVSAIKTAAGLPANFRAIHGLRHTYASLLASSGKVDLYTLQKLLTHKSSLMTQRYAHLRDDALKQASNQISELIKKIS